MFHNAEYIYAVYKAGSFSAAAKELYITQPCLSAMVKKKEEQLGVLIFDRNSRPLRLTEYGVQYIHYFEKIKNLEHECERYLRDIQGMRTGCLTVGANNILASFVLPSIIQSFKSKYPGIQVQIIEGNIDYLEDELAHGKLDLILENASLDTATFSQYHLCTEQLLLTAHKSIHDAYSLSDRYFTHNDIIYGRHMRIDPFVLSREALARIPVITLHTGSHTRGLMNYFFYLEEIAANIQLEVDQLTTAYNIACTGVGLTLISDTLVYNMPILPDMCYYKLPHSMSTRAIYMYHKRSRYVTLAMQKFMDTVIATLSNGIIHY